MSGRFRVTFQIVTFESAADGDIERAGFVLPGGWHFAAPAETDMTLREALELCCPQEDCGSWFCEVDERIDYRSGEHETRALHPPRNITASSYKRLRRLFGLERSR